MEVLRLYLGNIDGPLGPVTPMHGFVIKHPSGVVLVDTGMGSPPDGWRSEWKVVLRSVADALGDHDLSPVDVKYVMHTHLHTDHCGENVVFAHTPVIVQRRELERARKEHRHLLDRFDFVGAKFELLDGDAEVLPGIRAVFTPGHTSGHQSIIVEGDSPQLIVGDAAYTTDIWANPDAEMSEPVRQRQIQGDYNDWRGSLELLRKHSENMDRLHFCHDPLVLRPGEDAG